MSELEELIHSIEEANLEVPKKGFISDVDTRILNLKLELVGARALVVQHKNPDFIIRNNYGESMGPIKDYIKACLIQLNRLREYRKQLDLLPDDVPVAVAKEAEKLVSDLDSEIDESNNGKI